MKVLLCSPFSGKVGGISLWTKHMVTYFKNPDSDTDLTLADAGRKYDIYPNMPLHERIAKGIKEYTGILKKVKQTLKTEKFDIVHLVSSASISLVKDYLILRWAENKHIPTVIHFHFGRIPQIFKDKRWELSLLKKVIGNADRIVVIDPLSYQTLLDEGYTNVSFLPNPLSPDVVKTVHDHHSTERISSKIMFAGHVIPTKGIIELVDAFGNLNAAELHILGAVTEEMKATIIKRGGDRSDKIFVSGEKNHEMIIKEMLSSRIFVLPSYTEGFPNVILESMAAGCSIVSTNVGAVPEMLGIGSDKPCGIVVEPQNTEDLAAALMKLLEDSELADELAKNAVNKVTEDYHIETVTQNLKDIWKDTLKSNYENKR